MRRGLSRIGALAVGLLSTGAFAAGPLVVYDDQLRNGFADWSWATHSLSQTAIVHTGISASSFEPDGWTGFYLHRDAGIDVAAYEALDLWIHGGTSGGQAVRIALLIGGSNAGNAPIAQFLPGNIIPAGQWVKAHVPFSSLGVTTGVLSGFWLQDDTGGNQGAVYADDISFVERTTPIQQGDAVTIAVDPEADRRPISPLIYGVNFGSGAQLARLRFPVRRWGGNSTTRYSWEFDVANHASDWFFYNLESENPDASHLPDNSSADRFIDESRVQGSQVLLTVPMIGWVPFERTRHWGFSVSKYGAQEQTECTASGGASWCNPDAGNGVKPGGQKVTGNDPHDTSKAVGPDYVTRWMQHVASRVGTAAQGGVKLYALDNEPALWNSTHRDVHPQPLTYDELWTKTKDLATAIKTQDPNAQILGPVSWGWCEYFGSAADNCIDGPDRQAHGGLPLTAWYLSQVRAEEQRTGRRLVDYLDVHYYPQSGNVALSNDETPGTAALRFRSLKSLYDPAYVDESWINDKIRLIPRMKEWIAAYLPGAKLAITEYNWGGDSGPTSALAQAEVLAIFGREGVDLATRWVAPEDNSKVEDAFALYLNYDGGGSKITGDSIRATSSNGDVVGAYAIRGPEDRLYVLLFNKDGSPRPATVNVAATVFKPALLYRFDSSTRLAAAGTIGPFRSAFDLTLPARSATLMVIDSPCTKARPCIFMNGIVVADGGPKRR